MPPLVTGLAERRKRWPACGNLVAAWGRGELRSRRDADGGDIHRTHDNSIGIRPSAGRDGEGGRGNVLRRGGPGAGAARPDRRPPAGSHRAVPRGAARTAELPRNSRIHISPVEIARLTAALRTFEASSPAISTILHTTAAQALTWKVPATLPMVVTMPIGPVGAYAETVAPLIATTGSALASVPPALPVRAVTSPQTAHSPARPTALLPTRVRPLARSGRARVPLWSPHPRAAGAPVSADAASCDTTCAAMQQQLIDAAADPHGAERLAGADRIDALTPPPTLPRDSCDDSLMTARLEGLQDLSRKASIPLDGWEDWLGPRTRTAWRSPAAEWSDEPGAENLRRRVDRVLDHLEGRPVSPAVP